MDALKRSLAVCLLLTAGSVISLADETYRLVEEPGPTMYLVSATAHIKGKLLTPVAQGSATEWDLDSKATYEFVERRLAPTGRDAQAFRSVRDYRKADSSTLVGDHRTQSRLDPRSRLIVADGRTAGVRFYCPKRQLTRDTLDLLSSPGDPLAAAAMLPTGEVAVGEKWNPDQWVMQMLTDSEAAVKSRLTCELESVKRQQARVSISGHLEGASLGAASLIDVEGHLVFDLTGQYIRHFELKRVEERSAGTVTPGLNVTVSLNWDRQRTRDATLPADETIAAEPTDKQLRLEYVTPWGVRMEHDRGWHVFNESDHASVLRLVREGALVAQCNLARIPRVAPGTFTPPDQFVGDIQRTLGPRISKLEPGRVIRRSPTYVYSVAATGKSGETGMQWLYYLCAAPNGQQVSLVYSVAETELESLGDAPEQMTLGLGFSPATRVSAGPEQR